MAKKKLIIPRFSSEAEDARWHDRHRRKIESVVAQRIQEGSTLTVRQAGARARTRPVTIRLAIQDMDKARGLAAQKGIGYQTFIKMLLHEALGREAGER
jgi:predicted DNA binding CopG/RHH family protein